MVACRGGKSPAPGLPGEEFTMKDTKGEDRENG